MKHKHRCAQWLCTIGIARSTWVDFLSTIGRHIVFERTVTESTLVDLAISNVHNQILVFWGCLYFLDSLHYICFALASHPPWPMVDPMDVTNDPDWVNDTFRLYFRHREESSLKIVVLASFHRWVHQCRIHQYANLSGFSNLSFQSVDYFLMQPILWTNEQ